MTDRFGDRISAELRKAAWRLSYQEGARFMSSLRLWWQVFRNPKATIRFGRNVYAGPGFKVRAPWGGTLIVGDNCEFRRNVLFDLFGPDAKITVGHGCYFTYEVIISCATTMNIGERVGLGQNTYIVDGSHQYRDLT